MKIADQTETIAFLEAVLSRDGGEVRKIALTLHSSFLVPIARSSSSVLCALNS